MRSRIGTNTRRAEWSIWSIVTVALILGGGSTGLIVQSTAHILTAVRQLGDLRGASSAFITDHGRYIDETNSILRGAFANEESGAFQPPAAMPEHPDTTTLVGILRSAECDDLGKALHHHYDAVTEATQDAIEWNANAARSVQRMQEQKDAFNRAAAALRETLEGLHRHPGATASGVTRGAGNERDLNERIVNALSSLMDILAYERECEDAIAADATSQPDGRKTLALLDRLVRAIDEIVNTGPEANNLREPLDAVRYALVGNASDGAERAGSSGPLSGLIEGISGRNQELAYGVVLEARAAASLARARGLADTLRMRVDERARELRSQEARDLTQARLKALLATALGSAILGVFALSLTRGVRTSSAKLERALKDLTESLAQLVNIEELLTANERTAQANRELTFQKNALDLANIVAETDERGRITYVNERFCALSGYSRDELVGYTHRLVDSGRQSSAFWSDMFSRVGHEGVWQGTVCNRAKSGDLYWVRATVVAFRDGTGEISRYVSIGTDITDQKRAEQESAASAAFARATVDALTAHISILDERGNIIRVNRAWDRFGANNCGKTASVGPGANYIEICRGVSGAGEDEAQRVADGLQRVIDGEVSEFSMEYPCHSPDQQRWFMVRATRFEGDGPARVVVAHENITEIRQAQETLKAQAEALERATDAAESASRAKSEFLATMSHEIRTPLNGVVGTLDLLATSSLTEQQQRYIQIGKTSALSLTYVINDILDFSKIEAGKLELCPMDFDLRSAVQDVMEMLGVKAAERQLELACNIDPTIPVMVRGDADRLRQIIINLVNNAIKFTERGSVTLRATAESGRDGRPRVRFSVTDTGIGIAPDRLARLFKAFSQADASTTRKFGGTGLGLAISKRLAELMGGEIGVESELGHGSTFWFEAELPGVADAHSGVTQAMPAFCEGLRVMVIEDHDVQREFVRKALETMAFGVEVAADGETAIQTMLEAVSKGRAFDAVLVDFKMPDMDGVDVAVTLRSLPGLAQTPVILMSSAVDLDPARVLKAGFAAHLVKPIRHSALLDAIVTAVGAKAATGIARNGGNVATRADVPAGGVGGSRRGRLLLAEDNEINQMIAREMLARAGFECTVVASGAAAVAAVSRERFDLVLMDCQMPELDGFDATREIRRLEREGRLPAKEGVTRLPIIALTANALKGDRERCLAAGMDAYTSKPIDLKSLLSTIDVVLRPASLGLEAA